METKQKKNQSFSILKLPEHMSVTKKRSHFCIKKSFSFFLFFTLHWKTITEEIFNHFTVCETSGL